MARRDKTVSELLVIDKSGAKKRRANGIYSDAAVKKAFRKPIEITKRKPGSILERRQVLELLKKKGIIIARFHGPGHDLVLSPQRNYVEGHGFLNFINVSHVFSEGDSAWFIRQESIPDDYRKIEIWLTGLTVGASYMIQLRITGSSEGSFEIRGSDTTGVQTVAGGYQLTVPVLVHEVDIPMSLVTVEARNMWQWGFYDATVSLL